MNRTNETKQYIFATSLFWSEEDIEDVRQGLAECNDIDVEDVDDYRVYDLINNGYWDDVKVELMHFSETHQNARYNVKGTQGFWDGNRSVNSNGYHTLIEAIEDIIECTDAQDFNIYLVNGKLEIITANHDGTSYLTISAYDVNKMNLIPIELF